MSHSGNIDYFYNRFVLLLSTLAASKAAGRDDPELSEATLDVAEKFANAKLLDSWQPETMH